MAEESSGNSPALAPVTRSGPVLVPQAALLGKPDIALSRSVMTVGSRESSRIHLVSRSISQYHALFVNSSGTVAVLDLASRTGVQVNAKPVKYAELKTGDRVQIGKFLFRFRAPKPEAVAAPPDPAVLDVPGDLPVSLDTKMLIIGRRETCDLPLTDDTEVSTLHAVLFQHDGHWIVRDLDSRTGTRLNGIRVHQSKLAFGDTLKIGQSTFHFSPATEVLATSPAESEIFEPTPAAVPEPVAEPVEASAVEPIVEAAPFTELPTADAPLDLSATINTSLPEEPLEVEELPSTSTDDSITPGSVDEEIVVADEQPLDLGATHGFDLPLELDLAEPPGLPSGDSVFGESFAAQRPPQPLKPMPIELDLASADAEAPADTADTAETADTDAVQEAEEFEHVDTAEPPADLSDAPVASVSSAEIDAAGEAVPQGIPHLGIGVEATLPETVDVADEDPAGPSDEESSAAAATDEPVEPAEPVAEAGPLPISINTEAASVELDELPIDDAPPPPEPPAELVIDHRVPPPIDEIGEVIEDAPVEPAVHLPIGVEPPTAEPQPLTLDEPDVEALTFADETALPDSVVAPDIEEPSFTSSGVDAVDTAANVEAANVVIDEPFEDLINDALPPVEEPDFEAITPPAEVDADTETIDFGEPLPPELTAPPVKPVRKRTIRKKDDAPAVKPAPAPKKPRRSSRKKSVTPVVMDVVDTIAEDAAAVLPVISGGPLLPEVVAAIDLGDGLPDVDAIDTAAMLGIIPSGADEPTLTMTESMPVPAPDLGAEPAVVNVSSAETLEPVDTHDLGDSADHTVLAIDSTGISTEELLVESHSNAAAEPEPAGITLPSELLDEPASLHAAANASFTELAALDDGEEFVAIPAPEPSEFLLGDDADYLEGDLTVDEPAAEDTSLDLGEPPAAPAPKPADDDSGFDEMLGDLVEPGAPGSGASPPVFGFDFGGGSFLGGMPLSLQPPPPTFGKAQYAFDAKPPAAAPVAPTPAAAAPVTQAPSPQLEVEPPAPPVDQPDMHTAPAATVDYDESSLLSFDEPSMPSPVPQSAVVNTGSSMMQFDETGISDRLADDERSVTTTTDVRPAINTLADEVAIPPLVGRTQSERSAERQSLTTAFDGLAAGLGAGSGPTSVDVFSQVEQPIRDELFGSRGDNPADVVLPETQPEIPPSAPRRDPPVQIPPIDRAGPARAAGKDHAADEDDAEPATDRTDRADRDAYRAPDRFARLPMLALLALMSLIAAGMMIYFFLPPPVEVIGTLTFANLSKQPVSAQRQFAINQIQRLESGDIRNVARAICTTKAVGDGFLDDDLEFAKVTANADWDGDVMTLHHTATDDFAGRTRVMALLEALSQKDADLTDALARARRSASAAHDAVAAQVLAISQIRADRETQVRIGDSSPRLEDVAALERKANQLDAAWVAAKTQRANAQLALDKLRSLDPTVAEDPRDDPLLAELRTHQQDAELHLALAQATAAKPPTTGPAAEVDIAALSADVAQTKEAIDKRTALLEAEKTQTPEQRSAVRQAAVEAQSVRFATLQALEADASAAAQSAAVQARDQRAMLDAGRMASVHVEDLIHRQEAAEQTLKELSDDQAAKDEAVNMCVQIAATPKVDTKPGKDTRPISYALAGGLIVLLFGTMAVVSTRPVSTPMPLTPASAVPAAPIPVFGANRKPRETKRRSEQPAAASVPSTPTHES